MNSIKAKQRDKRMQIDLMQKHLMQIIEEEGLKTKILHRLVEKNGHKIVRYNECLPGHEYMSVFNYSEKYGGTIDSFRYYNVYVIDITE